MSTPYPPPHGGQDGQNYPGGYSPPPGGDPGYGAPSGPQPGPYPGGQPGQMPQGPPQPDPQQQYQPYPQQQPVPYQGQYHQQYYQQGYGAPVSSDDRTMGLIIHLGGFLLGFLLPLIMYLMKKDESPWIRHHSAQAFNFQVTLLIPYFIVMILTVVTFGIGGLLFPLVWVAALVFGILAAIAANKGEWYTYPVSIPMLK
ncbi:DUF4870 domain-containing protein [Halostreptopolyspora alba]|uniref:DUF4870 domain-containing protein n=1 Tax=Halostreptopolyspora alba TaxID=2487137 RepID=A0A3N0EE93_9ACTN|nr:DUF4870 domain-containing protein [Nocardiopsaceae bacterium YIM 96095]